MFVQLMYRPGDQFLSRAALALDQHCAVALGDSRQDVEYLQHTGILADNIVEGVPLLEFPPKALDGTEITECLDAPDNIPLRIFQDGGRYTDRDSLPLAVNDIDHLVNDGFSRFAGLTQRARCFANRGPKHFATALTDSFLSQDTGDLFGRSIE